MKIKFYVFVLSISLILIIVGQHTVVAQATAATLINQVDDQVLAVLLRGDWVEMKRRSSILVTENNNFALYRWLEAMAEKELGDWNDKSLLVKLTEQEIKNISDAISKLTVTYENNATVLLLYSHINADIGLDEKALIALERVIKLNTHVASAKSLKGSVLAFQGHLSDSEAAFSEALQIAPQRIDARLGRALVRMQSGPQASIEDIEAALQLSSSFSPTINLRGIIRTLQGQSKEAGQDFSSLPPVFADLKRNNILAWRQVMNELKILADSSAKGEEGTSLKQITKTSDQNKQTNPKPATQSNSGQVTQTKTTESASGKMTINLGIGKYEIGTTKTVETTTSSPGSQSAGKASPSQTPTKTSSPTPQTGTKSASTAKGTSSSASKGNEGGVRLAPDKITIEKYQGDNDHRSWQVILPNIPHRLFSIEVVNGK